MPIHHTLAGAVLQTVQSTELLEQTVSAVASNSILWHHGHLGDGQAVEVKNIVEQFSHNVLLVAPSSYNE